MTTKREQYARDDWNLIEQFQFTRSDADFARIVERFECLLMKWGLKARLGQRHNVLDAVQDAFLWLYENVDSLDPAETVSKQLMRVVRSSLRRNRIMPGRMVKASLFSETGDQRHDPVPFEETIVKKTSPAPRQPRRLRRIVASALDELPPKMREAIKAAYMTRETVKAKAARECGISLNSMRISMIAAHKRLESNPALRQYMGLPPVPPLPKRQKRAGLTDRQSEVVRLVHDKGISIREAGRTLGLFPHTAMYNWRSALKKIAKSKELQTLTGIGPGMYGI